MVLSACRGLLLLISGAEFGPSSTLAQPERDGSWVRPAASTPAQPVWGHADGLRVGLAPMPGPRGLLRIYAPYLQHPSGRMINFIAVEPIVVGRDGRGYSELEPSRLDGVRGKRFWSADDPSDSQPRLAEHPARGVLSRRDDVECLDLFILIERFDNGAHPYLNVCFRSDRPYEVGIASFAHGDSAPLRFCVLTATMGNYARLRRLHLANRVVLAHELWPRYHGDGFAPARQFPLADLTRTPQGHAIVSATPEEAEPENATYAPFTASGWKYTGRRAVQSWRCEDPSEQLAVGVNGRTKYWASRSPIPGGISFENFEMVEPMRDGQRFWFGVKPEE
jgi:hypothetical protein